jgi:hypothetical protein
MTDTQQVGELDRLEEGLAALAPRLESRDAVPAATALTQVLTQAVESPLNTAASRSRAEGLAAVAARLEPRDAVPVAAALARAIKDAKNPDAAHWLAARGLRAVAARLEPRDAVPLATSLAQAIRHTKDPKALSVLANGLRAFAPRLEPRDAAPVATALAQTIRDTKDPNAVAALAPGLAALATRLEAKDAAPIATLLAQAIKDARDPDALSSLVQGLGAVAARLEPSDAAALSAPAAITLAQAMKQIPAGDLLAHLTRDTLPALLSSVPPSEIPTRAAMAASATAFPAGSGQPLTALAPLFPVAEPPPCRLSTQQLVELLKMPPFVGVARRVVLDHLGNRYHQNFGDVWEFERFAREQNLDLDFAGAPHRPAPAASAR